MEEVEKENERQRSYEEPINAQRALASIEDERRLGTRRRHGRNATSGAQRLVTGLGWLSLGLGVAGLFATRSLVRTVGVKDRAQHRRIVRALGVRELVSGVGLLTRRRRAGWAWSRLLGDVMDLALLQTAMSSRRLRNGNGRGTIATAALLGVAALDGVAAYKLTRSGGREPSRGVHVFTSLTINRPPEEVYRFWRSLQNLPRFMSHLESIETQGNRSRWRAKVAPKLHVEWEAEITEDHPNERIAWRSTPGSQLENHGAVRFVPAPGGRGTEVHLVLTYEPIGGAAGGGIAKMFASASEEVIRSDLRKLKQILETGDVARSDASIHGGPHPARPSAERLDTLQYSSKKHGSVT